MIIFKNVKKIYDKSFVALHDINLTINDGDFLSIIGLSGAGKSTLLRTINQLNDIQEGEILVDVAEEKKIENPDYQKQIDEYQAEREQIKSLKRELSQLKRQSSNGDNPDLEKRIRDIQLHIYGLKAMDRPAKTLTKKTIKRLNVAQVKGKELRLLRRNIGMIFQSFNLVKRSSVYKNALSGRVGYHNAWETIFGIYSKREKMLALKSIDDMGILDKAYIRADRLSGGQQQRVALARALTQESRIILADEPTASLDPVTTISVMDDFRKINREKGITIVANMHHVDLALEYSNRIVGIRAGQIVFDGTPDQVTPEVLERIYGRALNRNESLGGSIHEKK